MDGLEKYSEAAELEDVLIDCKNGIITKSQLDMHIDNYISSLDDHNSIFQKNPMVFNGLLEYLYKVCISKIFIRNIGHSYDYNLFNDIFINIYIPLCYRFNYVPSITSFTSHLIHININNIYNIRHGIRHSNDSDKVNIDTVEIIKLWTSLCDSDLFDNIVHTNSVGSIFTAKVRGYSDQPNNMPMIQVNNYASIDAAQLDLLANDNGSPAQLPNL